LNEKHFQEIFLFPNPKGWKNILKILSKLHLLGTGKLILIKFLLNLCSVHSKYFFRKFAPNLLWKISLQKPLLFTRWVAN
jgi:hypothetical protein